MSEPTSTTSAAETAALHTVDRILSGRTAGWSREEWVRAVGACQSVVNRATAAQDVAMAQVARPEGAWQEDGTLGELEHAPGHVSLDAPGLVAPELGCSHAQAQRRVEQAVRLAAGRVPVEAGSGRPPESSGLDRLHRAMREGLLDGHRAGVVASELELAPPEVADAVVAALLDHVGDDAPTLRRRCRRLVARISPDLLRPRAERARSQTGLPRWVAEPGIDEWRGTFPSEDAVSAWAAIDHLAHDLVSAGTCSTVEQARGRALTDLVTGTATVEVQVVLTVPAGAPSPAAPGAGSADDLVEVQGARPSEPLLVRRGWLRDQLPKRPRRPRRAAGRPAPRLLPCDPPTGARLDRGDHLASGAYRPGSELTALVRARDGRCRFPGCSIAARFCDLDHVRPWPVGPTSAGNLLCLCRRHHRITQSAGWRVRLARDGTATWTDPIGRVRRTSALDALDVVVLASPVSRVAGQPTRHAPAQHHPPWSALHTFLELEIEHHPARPSTHHRCTSAAQLRQAVEHPAGALRTATAEVGAPPF